MPYGWWPVLAEVVLVGAARLRRYARLRESNTLRFAIRPTPPPPLFQPIHATSMLTIPPLSLPQIAISGLRISPS